MGIELNSSVDIRLAGFIRIRRTGLVFDRFDGFLLIRIQLLPPVALSFAVRRVGPRRPFVGVLDVRVVIS